MDINNIVAGSDEVGSVYSGYIINKYKVIKGQLDYVNSLVGEFNKDTQHLFKHILVSSLVNLDWSEWIPVYSGLIKDKLRQASWKVLEEAGLIEVTEYSIAMHKSREFKVLDKLILKFLELGQVKAEDRFKGDKYNLFTGKKDNKKQVSRTVDANDNEYSELVTSSVRIIKESLFNMPEIKKHIAGLQAKLDDTINIYGVGSKEYKTAFGQLKADETWFASIDNNALQIDENLWSYTPVYEVKMSGRIYAIRGLQCCSREMKAAAYTGVDELRNYDLKSSQVSGLQQQFELAGLDTTWLENYRNNPNAKKEYAAQVGVSVDCWKSCLCSLLFGASLSRPGKRTAKKMAAQIEKNKDKMRAIDTALLNYLYEESGRDEVKTLEYLDRFNKVVAPLKEQLDLWHDWLINTWVLKAGRLGRGSIYLDNAAGIKFDYTKESKANPEWKLKAMLSAFILQGIESAFIHALTVESLKHSYKVVANEHDGLIVIGEIPSEAVEQAALRSGLKYCVLEEKPLS
jgi:hypothetical protein